MKIFNWIFSSFFRTLGRFLFYIAVGLIAMLFISGKVNAESIEVTDATFNSSSIPYLIRLSADTTYRPLFELAVDSADAIKYNFGYMRICGTGEIEVTQDGDCTDGCLNDTINKVYNTNEKCTVADRSGKVTYIFFSINEWEIGSGNTSIWTLKDYMIYKNISTWYSYYQITNVYLTDSNLYPTFEEANAQNQTNNKLDTQINQNQTIIDQNNQTNDKLDDLNGNLTSTEGADLGALENSAGWLPAGPVDSILNLPLSLLNNLTTNLNKSCQPVILPIPYVNKDLTLPCVNTLYDDMGISGWVTTIGVIASAFIMFSYLVKLYKWVDDTLSFRENNSIDNWGGI